MSFIGNGFVTSTDAALSRIENPNLRRRILVVTFFAIIAATLALFGVLTIPDIIREGADFVGRLQSDNIWVMIVRKMREGLGCATATAVLRFGCFAFKLCVFLYIGLTEMRI